MKGPLAANNLAEGILFLACLADKNFKIIYLGYAVSVHKNLITNKCPGRRSFSISGVLKLCHDKFGSLLKLVTCPQNKVFKYTVYNRKNAKKPQSIEYKLSKQFKNCDVVICVHLIYTLNNRI